jgi:hypothetical protein
MNTYEFITPSDPITFQAENNQVAFAVAMAVGGGKAFCNLLDADGNTVKGAGEMPCTAVMFSPNAGQEAQAVLGLPLADFIQANRPAVTAALRSFCYGNWASRTLYDLAVAEITDLEKLREFKKQHDLNLRTSMSQWVNYAWQLADELAPPAALQASI